MTRPDTLIIETGVRERSAETYLMISGTDILTLEQRARRLDSIFRNRPLVYRSADPTNLLPPDSRALLPVAIPAPVMIGICTCGEPGCGSLWMQLRRDGDEVVWEPTTETPWHSIGQTYRFALVPYLDAIDAATGRRREDHPRLLARELRASRDSMHGAPLPERVLDVRSWPGVDHLSVSVAARPAIRHHRLPVGPDDSLDTVLARLREVGC